MANQQDLRVATNIIPDENDKYSLGSSNLRWKDIFVSANTITIGEAKLSSSPTGALEMSSVSFTERINLITSNELHTLSGINRNGLKLSCVNCKSVLFLFYLILFHFEKV